MEMGKAASDQGLTIQYCMPLWNDYLQSVEIQSVTQIRASDDYNPGRKQWDIGVTSMLAWSLGLIPFKDDFWTTAQQPGNPYNASEPNPELQTLVAALSYGPVGFSDAINYVNKTLIMKTCTTSGLLLKADQPATSIDRTFSNRAPNGYVWSTYSNISEIFWQYVVGIEMKNTFDLFPLDLPIAANIPRFFEWHNPNILSAFSDKSPIHIPVHQAALKAGTWPFNYYVIVPQLSNGFYILGEIQKFVTMSAQRFVAVQISSASVNIQIRGTSGEDVAIRVGHKSVKTLVDAICTIQQTSSSFTCTYSSSNLECKCNANLFP